MEILIHIILPFSFSQAIEKRIALEKKAVFEKRETETRRQHMDIHKDFEAVSFSSDSVVFGYLSNALHCNMCIELKVSVDRGWGVETSNIRNVNESEDPMLQQMQIMRNYIQQARYEKSFTKEL
jgi:hypothetical protein